MSTPERPAAPSDRPRSTAPRGPYVPGSRRRGRGAPPGPRSAGRRPAEAQAEPLLVRSGDPRDLLALVPHQLGFHPSRSLVLVSLRGPRRRVGLVARVDLPASVQAVARLDREVEDLLAVAALEQQAAAHLDLVVTSTVGHMVADGAQEVVAVLYDDQGPPGDPWLDPRDAGTPDLLQALLELRCREAGVGLRESWWVDGRCYRSLACRKGCCPPEGAPLAEVLGSRVAAEMVVAGSAPLTTREDLFADLVPVSSAAQEEARRGVAAERARQRRSGQDEQRSARVRVEAWQALQRAVAVERGAAEAARALPVGPDGPAPDADLPAGERHDPVLLGRLAASLRDPRLRDALLVSCLDEAGDVPGLLLRGLDDAGRSAALMEQVVGAADQAREPVPALVDPVDALLAAVVRHVPGPDGAEALGALAWSAWFAGDGARAVHCAQRSVEVAPASSMGQLVLDVLDAGATPAWVRARREEDQRPPCG
ncbi:DUF4192 domain-containing protein [Pseudokineococcus sp. 1T1Z-3]|uniref:DUF4192 domain-containing protein n=1 Tax=Pseudokineococcus sp. 1T1Z-3 TaxID=3132745 RepID=UPI0030B3DB07